MSTQDNKNGNFDDIIEREGGLKKQLTTSQLTMIAIGGAIGTGLFLGSGFAVSLAGPSVIISYVIGGLIALLMMFALSEMAVAHPVAGSFGVYAERYVNPWAGFVIRYSYWLGVVIGIGTEVTAIAIYMQRWFPQVPGLLWIFMFSAVLIYVNSTSVGNFGKFEFWFATIKVVAIVFFIAIGAFVVFGFSGQENIGFSNYTQLGGFMPNGWSGVILGSFIAIFSYFSMEMVAITAGEAKDPEVAVPKALKSSIVRLFLFYILSLGLMLAIVPWKEAGTAISPFVKAFQIVGIPWSADIMNFVVLTAALSAMNSMLYVTSRMMFSLSRGGYAPKAFGKISKKGVPLNALYISSIGVCIAAVVNEVLPGNNQYLYMMGLSMFGPVFTWLMILITHLFFRKKWKEMGGRKLPVKMPFAPYSTWLGILLLSYVVIFSSIKVFNSTLYVGIPWLIFISICYFIWAANNKKSLATGKNSKSQ